MQTLEDMEARAKRHLDGMTVNRDVMAKDVLQLVAAMRAIQSRNTAAKAAAAEKPATGFDWVDELLRPRR
jgi:hypothetical protein